MSEPRSDDEWVDFHADQRGVYDAFVERLEGLIETLLDEDEINYEHVISFSSGLSMYELNRARRDGRTFDNPLESQLRVAGVTITLATLVPVTAIDDLVRREFLVDPAGSLAVAEAAELTERLGRPVESGDLRYESPHYLVSLDERRLELPEWSRFAGLKVRIEVMTALQDAWEDIELDTPFFAAAAYPAEVRDLLARSAFGLSVIDADLAEAKLAIERLLEEYGDAVAAGELQLPVNGLTLLAYIRTSELVRSLTELGVDVGFAANPEYEPGWQDIEPKILWLLRRDDVLELAELEDFLQQATPRARETLAELARLTSDEEGVPRAQPETIVEWLWLILRRADAETVSLLRYRDEIEDALNTLIGNPVAERGQPADD